MRFTSLVHVVFGLKAGKHQDISPLYIRERICTTRPRCLDRSDWGDMLVLASDVSQLAPRIRGSSLIDSAAAKPA